MPRMDIWGSRSRNNSGKKTLGSNVINISN